MDEKFDSRISKRNRFTSRLFDIYPKVHTKGLADICLKIRFHLRIEEFRNPMLKKSMAFQVSWRGGGHGGHFTSIHTTLTLKTFQFGSF